MATRRAMLLGIGGLALAGAGYAGGAYREAHRQVENRLFGHSTVIRSRAGALEYAVAGDAPQS